MMKKLQMVKCVKVSSTSSSSMVMSFAVSSQVVCMKVKESGKLAEMV